MIRQPRKIDDRYIRMAVADLTTPKAGRVCHGPRWWHVTDTEEVLFFRGYQSPQCNPDRTVLDFHPIEGCTPRYIEMAFLPQVRE